MSVSGGQKIIVGVVVFAIVIEVISGFITGTDAGSQLLSGSALKLVMAAVIIIGVVMLIRAPGKRG